MITHDEPWSAINVIPADVRFFTIYTVYAFLTDLQKLLQRHMSLNFTKWNLIWRLYSWIVYKMWKP